MPALEQIRSIFKAPTALMKKRYQKLLDCERVAKLKADGEPVCILLMFIDR
jgi:hypothetical protein